MERIFFPLIAIGIVASVVFVQEGQRRIPIQYAKRMVGRRMTTGGATYLPLRVNMAGVIPVIFAAALLAFPATIAQYFPARSSSSTTTSSPATSTYLLTEAALIILFTLLHGGPVQPGRAGRNLRQLRRLHPRHPPGPAHCAVPRPRAHAPHPCPVRCSSPSSRSRRAFLPSSTAASRRRTPRALGGTSVRHRRQGRRGRGRRRRRRGRRRPYRAHPGRLAGFRRRHRHPGPDGQGRPDRPHPRPAWPDAEPEDRHRHPGRHQGRHRDQGRKDQLPGRQAGQPAPRDRQGLVPRPRSWWRTTAPRWTRSCGRSRPRPRAGTSRRSRSRPPRARASRSTRTAPATCWSTTPSA